MTYLELSRACDAAEMKREALGMEPQGAHLLLTLKGWPRGRNARVVPGLNGRVVGTDRDSKGNKFCCVDLPVVNARKWLLRNVHFSATPEDQ